MNRRGFFGLLGAAVIAPLVPVPDLLLPTRTIFLPPRGGWIARSGNQLLTPELFARELLVIFETQIQLMDRINREYDQSFLAGSRLRTIQVGGRLTIEGVLAT